MRRARPTATILIQASEYIWMAAQHPPAADTITNTVEAVTTQWTGVKPWARENWLLSLSTSLFLPKQSIMWHLKVHLQRVADPR